MTTYQIITVVFGFFTLLGGLIAGYVKIKTDLAKIFAFITELQANQIKISDNKADYDLVMQLQKETNSKLDQMNAQINIIVNKLIK